MSPTTHRTILIVDDSLHDRALITRLLRKQPREYTLFEARDGREGLHLVREENPDCVLVDHNLPDMNGLDFLDALQRDSRGRAEMAVAILTGQESDEIASESLNRGAQDYLVKDGLTGPALTRAIENAIEKFRIGGELVASRVETERRERKVEALREQLQNKVAELAEAANAKDQFMAVMSHEMRTPLNAIIGYADLLDMELDGELSARQREHVQRIQVGGRHLLDLINDVLDLTRADARTLDLDLRSVDLGAVLEEVVALLEGAAREKGVELITCPGDSGLPNVHADLNRLRQILTNLIGNALKFTEEGSVSVRCEATEDGEVLVHVVDTGLGIDPEVLPLVFDEFYQVSGELTREKGGSGLGLAISQRLATLMGGEITAESELGVGSRFTLNLRAAEPEDELRQDDVARHAARMDLQASAPSPRSAADATAVVAFGDHEEALAELERQVMPGVRLVWTTDPSEVAALAVREQAALVVLDIGSSNGDVWQAAHALPHVPELAETAILLLPSIPGVSADQETGGLNLGWLSLVPKPFTAAQITHAVSTAAIGQNPSDNASPVAYDVLVVDDDPDSRRVAAKFLSEAKLRVRMAADGETALMEMHRSPPDVLVLDLMMPVLDGFGVLAAMRADPALSDIPVVVLTAKSLTGAERRFLSRSAVRVLQKGEHRLHDVASLVLRTADRTRRARASTANGG
jgi:signal transduction histidine kinase